MQVLLKRSEEKKDIQCSVCHQGFRVFWERSSPAERETMRAIVLGELRQHHATDSSSAAHGRSLVSTSHHVFSPGSWRWLFAARGDCLLESLRDVETRAR